MGLECFMGWLDCSIVQQNIEWVTQPLVKLQQKHKKGFTWQSLNPSFRKRIKFEHYPFHLNDDFACLLWYFFVIKLF